MPYDARETCDVSFPTDFRTAGLSTMRWSQVVSPCIGVLALLAVLTAPEALDAKRKRRPSPPPLTIVNVTPSPVPFVPGRGSSLALDVTVGLPGNLDGMDVIEVSSLISFPSKRSIRFLFDRQPLDNVTMKDGKRRTRLTLLWDGKDQHRRYVRPGKYAYAVRAKLMAEEKGFVKARIVSRFERGTLDVSPPRDVVEQPDHPGHTPRPESAPSPATGATPRKNAGGRPDTAGLLQEQPGDST